MMDPTSVQSNTKNYFPCPLMYSTVMVERLISSIVDGVFNDKFESDIENFFGSTPFINTTSYKFQVKKSLEIIASNLAKGLSQDSLSDDFKKHLYNHFTNGISNIAKDPKTLFRMPPSNIQFDGILKGELRHFIDHRSISNFKGCPIIQEEMKKSESERRLCYDLLFYTDVVGFKAYNDMFGEKAGDLLMNYYFYFINKEFGKNDYMVLRRGQGDEALAYHMRMQDLPLKCPYNKLYTERHPTLVPVSGMGPPSQDPNDVAEACSQALIGQILCVYAPKKSSSEFVLRELDTADKELALPSSMASTQNVFHFRYLLRGMDFRYGDASCSKPNAEEKAWHKAKLQDKKARRGEFNKEVSLGLIINEGGQAKPRWFPPNSCLILVFRSRSPESIAYLREYIMEFPHKVYEDAIFTDITYFVISNKNVFGDSNEAERIVEGFDCPTDACSSYGRGSDLEYHKEQSEDVCIEKFLEKIIEKNENLRNMQDDDSIGRNMIEEAKFAGVKEVINEFFNLDKKRESINRLEKAYETALHTVRESIKKSSEGEIGLSDLQDAFDSLVDGHDSDSLHSLRRKVRRKIANCDKIFRDLVYDMSNELLIPDGDLR